MTFRATLWCDSIECNREYEMEADDPAEAGIEIDQIGWFRDWPNNGDYCPSCKKAVQEELKTLKGKD